MIVFAFFFVGAGAGVLALPWLPDLELLPAAIPGAVFGLRFHTVRWLSGVVLGACLTGGAITKELGYRITADVTPVPTEVMGMVIGLPNVTDGIVRFQFRVTEGAMTGSRLRLSWRQPGHEPVPLLLPGQVWRFAVRLRPPTGSVNFGIFDYEKWLFLKRIHGNGYVVPFPPPRLINPGNIMTVDHWRFRFREKLLEVIPPEAIGTYLALSLGETASLTQDQWQVLNGTGTTHLLIVSGLHIGLVGSVSFFLLRLAGVGIFFVAGGTIALTGAYALLAGWGLPVQRAFIMSLVFLLCYIFARHIKLTTQLAAAAVSVVIIDPLATLGNGFWLSFGAVAALIVGLSNIHDTHAVPVRWVVQTIRAQCVVFVSLIPVLGFTNFEVPVGSLMINLVAIPWVGIVLVPSLLLSSVIYFCLPFLGEPLLYACSQGVGLLWWFLDVMGRLIPRMVVPEFSIANLLLALAGVAVLLSPAGLLPRWTGLLLMTALLQPEDGLEKGDLRVTFLDVGQGLSVLLQSTRQLQVYDTGPTFGRSFSAAKQLVIPSIHRSGHSRIDRLVISHPDNDHAGGEIDIRHRLPVSTVVRFGQCDSRWQADEVNFRTFSVQSEAGRSSPIQRGSTNDGSCLLLVEAHGVRMLLTGDIEATAEHRLATLQLAMVDIMSVPHHGSASSSTPALLNSLQPKVAVISSGFRNRFDHPDPLVVARYASRSIRVVNTADSGGIELLITRSGFKIAAARPARLKIWRRYSGPASPQPFMPVTSSRPPVVNAVNNQ